MLKDYLGPLFELLGTGLEPKRSLVLAVFSALIGSRYPCDQSKKNLAILCKAMQLTPDESKTTCPSFDFLIEIHLTTHDSKRFALVTPLW